MRNRLTAISLFLLFMAASIPAISQTKPTDAEIKKFGLKIDSLANAGAWEKISKNHFDVEALGNRILAKIQLSEADKKDFMEGFKSGSQTNNIMAEFEAQSTGFKFLKVVERNKEKRALFRMEAGDGLNYLEFYVIKNTKNELKIADIYSYLLIDDISSSLASMIQNFQDSEMSNAASSPTLQTVKAMRAAQKEQNYNKILTLYNKLSPEDKKLKLFLTIRMTAAQNVGDEQYKAAMDDFYKAYPNEPGLSLLMIDRYFMEDNYAKTLEVINKTDSLVGGDPYLELYRGNLYVSTEEYDKAEASLEKFVKNFPKEEAAYPTYVSLLIVNNKFKQAVDTMKKWKKETGQNPDEFINVADYPEFTESPEYKAYAASK
ncbi:MAG TPA: hypothetical protein VEC12_01080 [Bacteroidia bacterium]|nr:hypothetical protein [Bacteroidia bacterium]